MYVCISGFFFGSIFGGDIPLAPDIALWPGARDGAPPEDGAPNPRWGGWWIWAALRVPQGGGAKPGRNTWCDLG